VERPYSWEEFLEKNEKQLKSYIGSAQQEWWRAATHEQTVISKAQFIGLLKENVAELNRKLQENYDDMYSKYDVTSTRLTNLKKMLESGGFSGGDPSSSMGKQLGAYIDPQRTSLTYQGPRPNSILSWLDRQFIANHIIPKPRAVISSVAREPGNCWPFAGRRGNLGLVLREPVFVTGLTLEHIEWSLALSKPATPKKLSLWANIRPYGKYDDVVAAAAVAQHVGVERVQAPVDSADMHGYARLGEFEYEFHENSSPIQTWMVPVNMRTLNVTSDRVVVLFTENYGGEYTCVYRVRVHGEPVKLEPQGGSFRNSGGECM